MFLSCYQPRTLLDLWGIGKYYTMAEALGIHTPSDVSMTLGRRGKLHAVSALHSLLSMFSGLKEHFQIPPYFPLIFPLRLPTLKPEVLPFSPLNLDLVLPLKLSLISSFIHSSWNPAPSCPRGSPINCLPPNKLLPARKVWTHTAWLSLSHWDASLPFS